MKKITFKYRDKYSNWEWRYQQCYCESVQQCIKFYGLNLGDVDYKIISVE